MKPSVIVDLKTERPNVGQPLPSALRILPFLFGCSILGAIVLTAYSFWQIKVAETKAAEASDAEAAQKVEVKRLQTEEESINKEVKNAKDVREWLAGTNQLQGLITTITRAMTQESTISQLTLARREEMSAQIEMALQMNCAHGQQQMDQIRTAVAGALGYHSYSDNSQSKDNKSEITFDCTWIKNDTTEPPSK
ncbi:MAG: hypothetical protein WCN98_12860 [Verrucomicrobiaceae bacterium]